MQIVIRKTWLFPIQHIYTFDTDTKEVTITANWPGPGADLPAVENINPALFYTETLEDGTVKTYTHDGNGNVIVNTITDETVVPGCNDPVADNYDPEATENNGTCVYSTPTLNMDAMPVILAAGNPINVMLHSRQVSNAPTAAQGSIAIVGSLSASDKIVINNITFTAGVDFLASAPGRTQAQLAESLAQAISLMHTLNAYYAIKTNGSTVELAAYKQGSAYDLTIATTIVLEGTVVINTTPAQNQYVSQYRQEWGCFVEVWANCGTDFGGTTDKNTAVMVQRLEQRYLPGNNYSFDIAECLRVLLTHPLATTTGHRPERMVSYFVKFGEIYGAPNRNRAYVGESAVCWAIDAAVPFDANQSWANYKILDNRPARRLVAVDEQSRIAWAGESFYFLFQKEEEVNSRASYQLSYLLHDGTTILSNTEPEALTLGGVWCLQLPAVMVTEVEAVKKILSCQVKLKIENEVAGEWEQVHLSSGQTLRLQEVATEFNQLVFANSLGGYDAVYLEGVPEDLQKRSLATVLRSDFKKLMRRASLERSKLLYSGLLTKAQYRWLLAELAASPDLYLNTDSAGLQPVPVVLNELDADPNYVQDEYFITADISPALGVNTLSN